MKIKFYPLKRNGEIAKTPQYTDSLNKEFCLAHILLWDEEQIYYECNKISLYEIYKQTLTDNTIDINDQLSINNINISTDQLKKTISLFVDQFNNDKLIPARESRKKLINSLMFEHKENINDLEYVATKMESVVYKYEITKKELKLIDEGTLITLINEDEDNENYHDYKLIIDDIKPITAENIIEFTTATPIIA